MDMLKRMSGLFLIAIAVVVAVHAMVEPLYHTSSEAQMYSPLWVILNPFMVLAVVLGLIFGCIRKRGVDRAGGSGAITREFLAANTLFYGFLFVGILLIPELVQPTQSRIHRNRSGYHQLHVGTHRRYAAAACGRDGDFPAAGRQQRIGQRHLQRTVLARLGGGRSSRKHPRGPACDP